MIICCDQYTRMTWHLFSKMTCVLVSDGLLWIFLSLYYNSFLFFSFSSCFLVLMLLRRQHLKTGKRSIYLFGAHPTCFYRKATWWMVFKQFLFYAGVLVSSRQLIYFGRSNLPCQLMETLCDLHFSFMSMKLLGNFIGYCYFLTIGTAGAAL